MSLKDEWALVLKLKSLKVPCNAFDGVTSFEERRQHMRACVRQVPQVVYSIEQGKVITMARQFGRVYNQDLEEL